MVGTTANPATTQAEADTTEAAATTLVGADTTEPELCRWVAEEDTTDNSAAPTMAVEVVTTDSPHFVP